MDIVFTCESYFRTFWERLIRLFYKEKRIYTNTVFSFRKKLARVNTRVLP